MAKISARGIIIERLLGVKTGTKRALAWTLVVALAVLVYATPEPSQRWRSVVRFCDFGHVLAFAVTTIALFYAAGGQQFTRLGYIGRVAIAASLSIIIGAAVEYFQALSGGNGEFGDVWRDGGGALCAGLLLLARMPSVSRAHRCLYGCLAASIVAWFFLPTARAMFDEVMALRDFPVLVSFAHSREIQRFGSLPSGAHLDPSRDPDGHIRPMLRMHWLAEKYPGFELSYFPGDWRGWRALQISICNLKADPIRINVRLDDADYRYVLDADDRYDGEFTLHPGFNLVDVPLADVAVAPRRRAFDLGKVRLLLVHGVGIKTPVDLFLAGIRLIR